MHAALVNVAGVFQVLSLCRSLFAKGFVVLNASHKAVAPMTEFVRNEILRVGAPLAEIKSAIALVGSGPALDVKAYDALSPRMRRLVDLIDVAGGALAVSIYETSEASPADV